MTYWPTYRSNFIRPFLPKGGDQFDWDIQTCFYTNDLAFVCESSEEDLWTTAFLTRSINSQNSVIICSKELIFYYYLCWILQLGTLLKMDSVIDVFISWKLATNEQMNRTPAVLRNAIGIVCKGVPAPPFFKACTPWPSLPLPLFKIFVPPLLFLFHPLLRHFRQFPHPQTTHYCPNLTNPNIPWFKQISKGQFYQFNCRFLSKISF